MGWAWHTTACFITVLTVRPTCSWPRWLQLIAKLHNLVTGLPVLRGCGTLLLNGVPELQAAVDAVAIARWKGSQVDAWAKLRMELLGSVATLVVCLFTVFVVAGDSRKPSQASGAGMVVVFTLNLGRVHYVLWSAVARASRTL